MPGFRLDEELTVQPPSDEHLMELSVDERVGSPSQLVSVRRDPDSQPVECAVQEHPNLGTALGHCKKPPARVDSIDVS